MIKKIGIYGGSFNPIHNGHLRIIEKTLEKGIVDELWVMPCGKHAFDKKLADSHHRLEMLMLATKDMKNVRVESSEIYNENTTYTADTFRILRSQYIHDFYFIMGSDLLKDIDKWHDSDYLKTIKYVIYKREGYPIIDKGLDTILLDEDTFTISSSEIRKKFLNGKDISNDVPKSVAEYIQEHDVYTDPRDYRNPSSTVDIIVPYDTDSKSDIGSKKGLVLVKRGKPPYKDHWCFPGGHLEYGQETLEQAAVRELFEETNLETSVQDIELMKVYSNPERDPRCHAISHAFIVKDYQGILQAGDDAADVKVFYDKPEKLAFDHSKMWDDYMQFRKFNDR